MRHLLFIAFIMLATIGQLAAALAPDPLFADHAVLQHGVIVPVWGLAEPGEEVAVEIAGQRHVGVADAVGRWRVDLNALAPGGPHELVFRSGAETLTRSDILIGEVWLCSGQSNMARPVVPPERVSPRFDYWESAAAQATQTQIREFKVRGQVADETPPQSTGSWAVCTPEAVREFSAVGYFFARDLSAARGDIPVGIITAAVGATGIESWMSLEAMQSEEELASLLAYGERRKAEFPETQKQYEAELAAYQEALGAQADEAKTQRKKPKAPRNPFTDPYRPTGNFHGKIAPLMPYAIKGAVWYQGENNMGKPKYYRYLLRALITFWRRDWGQGDFPVIVIQLPDYKKTPPEFRVAQLEACSDVPQAALVVTTDCGDAEDIHPPNKEPVGQRVALAARVIAYGEDMLGLSPQFASAELRDKDIVVTWSNASGLNQRGDVLRGFEVAGKDKAFVAAAATIDGERVIVSPPAVVDPVFIRYAWQPVPDANLYNAAGLPAGAFSEGIK